jgi:hypothetical protein
MLETLFRTRDDELLRNHYTGLLKTIFEMQPDLPLSYRLEMERVGGVVDEEGQLVSPIERDSVHFFFLISLLNVDNFRMYCLDHSRDETRLEQFIPLLQRAYSQLLEGKTVTRCWRGVREEVVPYPTYTDFVWDMRYQYLLLTTA